MNESITLTTQQFSSAASLAAIGVKLSQLDLFGPIRTQLWKQNKVVPKTGVFRARIHEINVNLICSQNCCWNL
jgi:hypothetical protein